MKIQDLMHSNFGSIKLLREMQDQVNEKDWRSQQKEAPRFTMIPSGPIGIRMNELKILIPRLLLMADSDLHKGDQGICNPANDLTWMKLIEQEKKWAREMIVDLNKPRAFFGKRFLEDIVLLHETAYFECTPDHKQLSRYLEVIEQTWKRVLDIKGEYREITECDYETTRKRKPLTDPDHPVKKVKQKQPEVVIDNNQIQALKDLLSQLKTKM